MSDKKSIFDLLNDLTFNKVPWDSQSEVDKKSFQTYMITRWLSMHPNYTDLVAECQVITDTLTPEQFYNFYLDILPKKKFFTKYVSRKSEQSKYTKLISFLKDRLKCSYEEMEDNLETMFELPGGFGIVRNEMIACGFDEKQLKKEYGL